MIFEVFSNIHNSILWFYESLQYWFLDSSSSKKQLHPKKTILVAVIFNKEQYKNEEKLLQRNKEMQQKAAMFAAITEAIWRTYMWDLERKHSTQIFQKKTKCQHRD